MISINYNLTRYAVIFDMDGLMLNTESLGLEAWTKAVKSLGYQLPREVFLDMIGLTKEASQQVLLNYFGEDFPAERARLIRKEIGNETDSLEQIKPQPGLIELLDFLNENNIPRAVATSTEYETAIQRLERVGIANCFDHIVTGDMVKKSKPDPDIFLEAAARLGFASKECVILEDSENGIKAAFSAGAIPIMVPDLKKPSPEIVKLTHKICDSLYQVAEILNDHPFKNLKG